MKRPGRFQLARLRSPSLLRGGRDERHQSERIDDAIERLRFRRRELIADRRRVQSAPIPSADAKAVAGAQIDRLAQSGEPYTAGVIEYGQEVVFATKLFSALVRNVSADNAGAVAQAELPDVLGLLAWTFRDELKQKIFASIDEDSDDAAALSAEQRAEQLSVIEGDLLANDRLLAAAVWQARRDGSSSVEFDRDLSPLAILGIELVKAGPQQPSGYERSSLPPRQQG